MRAWCLRPLRLLTASKLAGLLAAAFGVWVVPDAEGAVLRHDILETDTAESVETERVCYSLKTLKNGRLLCLPTPYLVEDDGRLALDLLLKADAQAYAIATRVLGQNVDKPFVNSLFNSGTFQSVSASATLRAIYSGTAVSYTPLHVIGAFKLSNPSLPEVHVAGLRQSVLRLEHHVYLIKPFRQPYWDLLVAPSVYDYQRDVAYLDTDILSAAVAQVANLVEKKTTTGVDADLAVAWLARRPFLPSVSVRLENLAAGDCTRCDPRFFDIEREVATRALVSVSAYVSHPIGESLLGVAAPFYGPLTRYDTLKTTVAYAYKLAKLECFTTFAPTIYTFGFLFDSDVYRLGITYSDEKQENSIQIARQKETYVFTSFFL